MTDGPRAGQHTSWQPPLPSQRESCSVQSYLLVQTGQGLYPRPSCSAGSLEPYHHPAHTHHTPDRWMNSVARHAMRMRWRVRGVGSAG